jgi:RNA polymerase sigma-19 factor, ECF subfamily
MNEKTLYNQIKQDNAKALERLFNLHYKPLCTYVVQFTKSMPEAEDIVQSIFVRLWASRETLTIVASPKAYLYRSAHNAYIDKFRKSKKEITVLETLKYEALSNQLEEDDTLLQQRITKTKKLINGLPKRCKEIVLLSKQEGYKNREIAEKLGISIKTVEAQLAVAFKKIRDGFEGDKLMFFLLFRRP